MPMNRSRLLAILALTILPLAGCNDALETVTDKVEHPLPKKLVEKMKAHDMSTRSPIMMRIFKEEGVLEVWKQKGNGRFDKITEYKICAWSGKIGPKIKEGDRQAPEGYYRIYPAQMNPNSSYYLSFNTGYPNGFDRAHGRTGTNLMIHGACSSAGCYSMTDEQVLEIYGFAREAFRGGQPYFTVAAYPFRMTPENMARHRNNENFEFWKMIKIGYDQFELTKQPPQVEVCDKRYVFNQIPDDVNAKFVPTASCPATSMSPGLVSAYNSYESKWNAEFTKAVAKVDRDEAKRLEAEAKKAEEEARKRAAAEAAANAPATTGGPIGNLFSSNRPAAQQATPLPADAVDAEAQATVAVPTPSPVAAASAPTATAVAPAETPAPAATADAVPVPTANPNETAAASPAAPQQESAAKKPFWKLWSK